MFHQDNHIIIFVKEYNAYYIGKYDRNGMAVVLDGFFTTMSGEVFEDYLNFELMPIGKINLKPYDVDERYQKWLNDNNYL